MNVTTALALPTVRFINTHSERNGGGDNAHVVTRERTVRL
jgi:hypothetical protein